MTLFFKDISPGEKVAFNDPLDLLIYQMIEFRHRPASGFFDQKEAIIAGFRSPPLKYHDIGITLRRIKLTNFSKLRNHSKRNSGLRFWAQFSLMLFHVSVGFKVQDQRKILYLVGAFGSLKVRITCHCPYFGKSSEMKSISQPL